MKRKGFDSYTLDPGEPVLRSCWECNSAHEHLKDVSSLHFCPWCERYWIFGRYLDSFASAEELDEFLKAHLTPAAPDSQSEPVS